MALGYLRNSPRRITRGLLDSQFVESLVSPNPVERYIGLLDPTWSRRDVRAEVVGVDRQTPRSVTLTLQPNSNWAGFVPGQHVGLTVEIDGVLTTRYYSPASRPADKRLELTISAHPAGKVSNFLVKNARVGMILGLSPAEGEFVLPSSPPGELLLISGGSGITPMMSILRTLLGDEHAAPITFLHYARTGRDALYREELERLAAEYENLNLVTVLTRETGPKLISGRLSREQLKSIHGDHANAEAYVCGPESLIAAAESIWSQDQLEDKLHTELFSLPEPLVVTEDAVGSVRFTKSGVEVANDGQSLLVQAEQGGLSPRHGCRMGICHTCVCRLESGTVRNVRTGEVKTVSNELVQICVNAPVGDMEIDL
ncbi:MAG: ferredoxin reductase [Solirubrobacterales bacterium]|nr:ferredoxin reductase [Solirubrobacterales bacterium]